MPDLVIAGTEGSFIVWGTPFGVRRHPPESVSGRGEATRKPRDRTVRAVDAFIVARDLILVETRSRESFPVLRPGVLGLIKANLASAR